MSIKISALPPGTTPTGAELVPAVQTGVTVSLTVAQIRPTLNQLLPPQFGNAGKFLSTDGTNANWTALVNGSGTTFNTNKYDLGGTLTGTTTINTNNNSLTISNNGAFIGRQFFIGNASMNMIDQTVGVNQFAQFYLAGELASMDSLNGTGGDRVTLDFNAGSGLARFTDGRASKKGIEYAGTGYVTQIHSLIDKEYGDAHLVGLTFTNSPSTGNSPVYNGTNFTWQAAVTSLSGLTDVNISSPANNQFLQYQTSDNKWHNHTLVAGDIPTLNQNTTGSAGSVLNVLSIGTELISGGASSYNGSAAKTIGIQSSSVTNAMLANPNITIAGNSTALGGSVTQDNITGLSSTGLIKRTGANTLAIASSGTDYAPATSGGAILYANGSGGFSSVTVGSGLSFITGTLSATGTSAYSGLSDVNVSSIADAQLTQYRTSDNKWHNFTLSGDATVSNAGALTIGTGAVTPSKIANKQNKQPFVGYIFQETWSGTLGNYTVTQPGSTISLSGGTLTLTGSANNYANYITRNYNTAASVYKLVADIKPTADGNGVFIGVLQSSSTNLLVEMDANTAGARGTVYITLNGTRVATSSSVLSYTTNSDVLTFTIYRNSQTITGTVLNKTTGNLVSVTFGQDYSTTGTNIKYGSPCIGLKGGTFTLSSGSGFSTNSFTYYIYQKKGSPLLIGDSITDGYYAGAENQAFSDILRQLSIDPIEKLASGGSTTSNWTNLTTEINNFAAPVIYIMLGMNDAIGSVTQSTYAANLTTIEGALTGSPKIVYLYVTPHGSSSTVNGFINQYNTTLSGKTNFIDTNTPLLNASTSLADVGYINADNIHPNAAGHAVLAYVISQNSTTDIAYNSTQKTYSYLSRGGSVVNVDKNILVTASTSGSINLTSGTPGILFNTQTVNNSIYYNFNGGFSTNSGNTSGYAVYVWPNLIATANSQNLYQIVGRENPSFGAFTRGGSFGLAATDASGVDRFRVGLHSNGTTGVAAFSTSTVLCTIGNEVPPTSYIANFVYTGNPLWGVATTTSNAFSGFVAGSTQSSYALILAANGHTSTSYGSNIDAAIIDNRAHAQGTVLFYQAGTTNFAGISKDLGGRLSLGSNSTSANFTIAQAAQSSGSPLLMSVTGAAHTSFSTGVEATEILIDLSATLGQAAGALTNQRTIRIKPRTYTYNSSTTITTGTTLSLEGAPIMGTNASQTTGYGILVSSANVGSGTSTSYGGFFNAMTGGGTNWGLGINGNLQAQSKAFFGGTTTPTALVHLAAGTATANTSPLKFTSGTSLTTAEAGAIEYDGINFYATPSGTTRKTLMSSQTSRSTAQTASVASVTTWTVGSNDGSFMVSANVNLTASTTNSFTVTCTYTDETNTSRTDTFSFVQNGVAAPLQTITNVTGVGSYSGLPMHIRCKAATSITIATTGTFTSVTYNVEGMIIQVN